MFKAVKMGDLKSWIPDFVSNDEKEKLYKLFQCGLAFVYYNDLFWESPEKAVSHALEETKNGRIVQELTGKNTVAEILRVEGDYCPCCNSPGKHVFYVVFWEIAKNLYSGKPLLIEKVSVPIACKDCLKASGINVFLRVINFYLVVEWSRRIKYIPVADSDFHYDPGPRIERPSFDAVSELVS